MMTDEMNDRFTKMQKDIIDELAERDREIMEAESKVRAGDNIIKPELLAEMRMARRARALEIKMRSKTRQISKVEDFLASIRSERTKRKYPLESSSSTDNIRRSEFLTMKAERFVDAVDNIQAFVDEFLAGEPEYQSRLMDWAEVKHLFKGDPDSLGQMTKLRGRYDEGLELTALQVLERQAEALLRRVRFEFALGEVGQIGRAKTLAENELRGEIMSKIYTDRVPPRDLGLDALAGKRG